MTDIVERLRRWVHAVDAVSASDLMDEAAYEIERLRPAADSVTTFLQKVEHLEAEIARMRLTDAEREAVERGYCSLMGVEDMSAECSRWDAEAADTLRGLLERLGGGDD